MSSRLDRAREVASGPDVRVAVSEASCPTLPPALLPPSRALPVWDTGCVCCGCGTALGGTSPLLGRSMGVPGRGLPGPALVAAATTAASVRGAVGERRRKDAASCALNGRGMVAACGAKLSAAAAPSPPSGTPGAPACLLPAAPPPACRRKLPRRTCHGVSRPSTTSCRSSKHVCSPLRSLHPALTRWVQGRAHTDGRQHSG